MTYYIGLDMGTSSVGWAVTDEEYHLVRKKGKDMWGVRLFPEASTSAERRTKRVAKRRLAREKARLGFLKECFSEEIEKIDPGFYQRLEDSKFYQEDKMIHQPYALFADTNYTDRDYYEQYPTIFHLRKELIESTGKKDVRLVYLALNNMFKHRGHFLNSNLDDTGIGHLNEQYSQFIQAAKEVLQISFPELEETETLEQILSNKATSNTGRSNDLLKFFNVSKTKEKGKAEICKMICGLTGVLPTIFTYDTFNEDQKKFSLSFRDGNYEEKIIQASEILSDDSYELLLQMKQIHDWGVLANIMKGKDKTYQYLSMARVDAYEKHQEDLKILKKAFKKYAPEKYHKMFRILEDNNYSAYVGSVLYKNRPERRGAKAGDFFKNLEKIVKQFPDSEEKAYILEEISMETFLPKQLTSSNGVIPNQVHRMEMKKILENAECYLPFLKEKDDTGLSVSEKILEVFSFQIPYFIGPLAGNIGKGNVNSKNSWSVRKEKGKIYPWNFEQKIDKKESAQYFIDRMVKHCTYLNQEQVLPKNSLLYEKFTVLNELNNLRINGEKISVKLKQSIYNDLFKTGQKVTEKKLKDYLLVEGHIQKKQETAISGIDKDFTNRLKNYSIFRTLFNVDVLSWEQEKIAEDIILWSTVYGDTKSFVKEKIKENYGDILSKEQIKKITGFKFKDWGRLSKELLLTEGADSTTGEIQSIIQCMWNTNDNFMELLSPNKYTYFDAIQEKTRKIEKTLFEIEYEDLEDYSLSAPVKRMAWQTILILKEIRKVMGEDPARIFVEMARDANAEKTRKDSRKKKFLDLYKNCKVEGKKWVEEINKKEESDFRSKKLYLYYTQMGRCMYTGEVIELSDLWNDNLYDIDHIYPRHFVKDDSIENNLVLVKKEKNAHKSDSFPIEASIRNNRADFWKMLKDGKFITDEKYKRLMRNTEFTEDEQAAFINRQLVETRQGTKIIAGLFSETFKNSEIIYAKAGNVSAFRQKFELLKCREVNDFHHANDAYLNIVVGNVYHTKFTANPYNFIQEYRKNPKQNPYHMYRLFEYKVARNGKTAWETENDQSIRIVKAVMKKNTVLVTKMTYEAHGQLSDQNIVNAKQIKKANGVGYLPIKTTDERLVQTQKYGGYNKISGAYFFLVEHELKGKQVRTIETVPIYLKDQLDSVENLTRYCREELQLINPVVKLKKIKMNSLLKVNGFYLYLTGRTGKQLSVVNAVQLKLDSSNYEYIRNIFKHIEETDENILNKYGITKDKNENVYEVLLQKHLNGIYSRRPNPVGIKLKDGKEKFLQLSIEKQIKVLLQIIQLSQLINQGANLTDIGASAKTGVSLISKKVSDIEEIKIVNQSPAGLFESEIDLLKI